MTYATRKTFSGWWQRRDRWGQRIGFEAYRRNASADAFDLFPAATWWQAMAYALELAEHDGCSFEGGPAEFTFEIERRAGA